MGLFDKPSPPDPTKTAQGQLQYNKDAATAQAGINMVDQTTPFGTVKFNQAGTNPDGTPKYEATSSASPEIQALITKQLQTPANIDPSVLTNKMMGWGQDYLQPVFDQQQSQLDSKLAAQGITQGSKAFDNAQNLQSRNVNDAYKNLFLSAEPQAFNQSMQEYMLPSSTISALTGSYKPGTVATPTETIASPNYTGLVQSNYEQQMKQQQAMIDGLFKTAGAIGGAALGGPIGASLGSTIGGGWAGGGFDSSAGGSPMNWASGR